MTKERLQEVLDNILGWAVDHDDEFVECLIHAADFTDEELKELDLYDYAQDVEDDDEDTAFEELNFQLGTKFKSATLWDGDEHYIEVRYAEEVSLVEDLVKSMGYEIDEDQTGWCEGSDYEAYYIWLKSRG